MFATTRARWLGQPVTALIPDTLPPPGADWQLIALTRSDGSTLPADLAVTETRFENDVFRSVRLRDATERLHREQALIEAREVALSASRLKSQFLAMLGHELLTPLHSIIGFGELIRDANATRIEAVWASEALASAHGLLDIVTAMIDLMRIEGGLLAMRPQLIDIQRMLRERARAWSLRDSMRVTVALDLAADLPPVLADGPRLRQALDNLLSNATRFSPPESTVDVVAGRDGDMVVLRIRDRGPGMTPDALASALEPFRQADGRLARSVNGLGLGLPIARGLIELLGGRLTVDTAPMAGTTVVLRLPIGSEL
jgi:signal transduction histidine kinase